MPITIPMTVTATNTTLPASLGAAVVAGGGSVYSVNGMTGDVVLTAEDVGAAESFVAIYGETTSAEIEEAYQAGKICLCRHSSEGKEYYYYLTRRQSSTIHDFGGVQWGTDTPTVRAVYCESDTWHGFSRNVAPVNSPAFTGTPTAPTAATGTDTSQIATTAFVQQELGGFSPLPSGGNQGDVLINSGGGEAAWVAPASSVEEDNTRPITSAAVFVEVGNINALLATI